MEEIIVARAREALGRRGLQAALLAHPASVTWLTGYVPPILSGPSPFEGGPAIAWLDQDRVALFVSDVERNSAAATGVEVSDYTSYQIEGPLQPVSLMVEAFGRFLADLKISRATSIGVESLPLPLWRQASSTWTGQTLHDIDGWTDLLRAIKTPAELEKIRSACALCSTAQATLRSTPLEGRSELELYGLLTAAMENQAGERLPVLADMVAGMRTAQIGGPPTPYIVQNGDPVLADIVPRLHGYWGDICNVHFAGGPSEALRKMYRAARDALYAAIDTVKPGVPASKIDEVARQVLEKNGYVPHPHHTGHGVGVTYHEEPRICGYNGALLQPGMVLALEPGVYVEGVGGVRLEHVIALTADGVSLLTDHTIDI